MGERLFLTAGHFHEQDSHLLPELELRTQSVSDDNTMLGYWHSARLYLLDAWIAYRLTVGTWSR